MKEINKEQFKINLILDLANPYSCISYIRRCMNHPDKLWFWNKDMLDVSNLGLKIIFAADNSINFVEYDRNTMPSKMDNLFDLSEEIALKGHTFLIESTFIGSESITFVLNKYRIGFKYGHLVFDAAEPVKDYSFEYNTKRGMDEDAIQDVLPVYTRQYQDNLKSNNTIYCLSYFNEQLKSRFKNLEWSNKTNQYQKDCINTIEKICSSSESEMISWHDYLITMFIKMGTFKD